MTEKFLERVRALRDARTKATPGEWKTDYFGERILHGPSEKYPSGGHVCNPYEGDAFVDCDDADFTCLAANETEYLCDLVEMLAARVERAEDALERHKKVGGDGGYVWQYQNAADALSAAQADDAAFAKKWLGEK